MLSHFSHVRLFATLWTAALESPLSMGFSRQECWSGLPCPPPRDLPNPDTEPMSLTFPALTGWLFTTSVTWEAFDESAVFKGNKHMTSKLHPGVLLKWTLKIKIHNSVLPELKNQLLQHNQGPPQCLGIKCKTSRHIRQTLMISNYVFRLISTTSYISTSETKHLMYPSPQPMLCLFAHCSHSLKLTLHPLPSPTPTGTSIWPNWQAPFTIQISHLQLLLPDKPSQFAWD